MGRKQTPALDVRGEPLRPPRLIRVTSVGMCSISKVERPSIKQEEHPTGTRWQVLRQETKPPWIDLPQIAASPAIHWMLKYRLVRKFYRFLLRVSARHSDRLILKVMREFIQPDTVVLVDCHNSGAEFAGQIWRWVACLDALFGERHHPVTGKKLLAVLVPKHPDRMRQGGGEMTIIDRTTVLTSTPQRLEKLRAKDPARWLANVERDAARARLRRKRQSQLNGSASDRRG